MRSSLSSVPWAWAPAMDLTPSAHVPSVNTDPASSPAVYRRTPPRRPPPPIDGASSRDPDVFPAHLFSRPSSVFVYGQSRALVNLTLFTLASATNPRFQWVEIALPKGERVAPDPVQLGWIPEDQLWRVDQPEVLGPDERSADLPIFDMIRSDEAPETLALVAQFLRLSDTSQRILSTGPVDGRPGVVAITNAHRLEGSLAQDRVAPILAVHRAAGFSVLVAYSEAAGTGRSLFDFVFHLQGGSVDASDWPNCQLVCERGITTGPLRGGRPVGLAEIPMLADILARATRTS